MVEVEWSYGFFGGLMIGAAGALFLLVNGRILGPSGILGGLLDGSGRENRGERVSFIAGLICAATLTAALMGRTATEITGNWGVIISAGILVGLGSRMANGCIGGHAICGIARFSLRGFIATILYVLAGGLSVFTFRHLLEVI